MYKKSDNTTFGLRGLLYPPSLTNPLSNGLSSLIPPKATATNRDLKSPLTKKWSPLFHRALQNMLKRQKHLSLRRIKKITNGLTMPEISNVPLGSAKKMEAAILFFDLENFTTTSSKISNELVLYTLNSIIPMIMQIVRKWNGEIEKNTGDGIMAIFGTETRNSFLIARDAIESAMVMRYVIEMRHKDWRWTYPITGKPYRFFNFDANFPEPKEWIKIKLK